MAPPVQGSAFFFDRHIGKSAGITCPRIGLPATLVGPKSSKLFLKRKIKRSPGLSRNVGDGVPSAVR
jgi:hypothetical protein